MAVRRDAGASVGLAFASAYRRHVARGALAAALGWRTSLRSTWLRKRRVSVSGG